MNGKQVATRPAGASASGSSLAERLAHSLLFVESKIGGTGCAAKTAHYRARVWRLWRPYRHHWRLLLLVVAAATDLAEAV